MSIDQYGWPPMNGQSVKNWAPEVKHARKIFLLHKKTFLQIQTLELYQLFRVWRPTNMLRFFLLIFLLVLVFYQVYLGSWMICIFAWLSHWHCHCPGGGRAQGWAGWRREVFGRQILVLVLKILLFVLKILLFIKIVLFVFQVEMLFCNNHCSKRGRIGEPFFSHDSLEWTTAWKPKQAYSPMGPGEAGFPDQAHPPHIIIILVLPVIIIILALLQEKLVFQIKLILSPIKIIQLSWVMRRYSWIRSKVFFRRVDVDDPWQSLKETVPLLCKTQLFESFFFKWEIISTAANSQIHQLERCVRWFSLFIQDLDLRELVDSASSPPPGEVVGWRPPLQGAVNHQHLCHPRFHDHMYDQTHRHCNDDAHPPGKAPSRQWSQSWSELATTGKYFSQVHIFVISLFLLGDF